MDILQSFRINGANQAKRAKEYSEERAPIRDFDLQISSLQAGRRRAGGEASPTTTATASAMTFDPVAATQEPAAGREAGMRLPRLMNSRTRPTVRAMCPNPAIPAIASLLSWPYTVSVPWTIIMATVTASPPL